MICGVNIGGKDTLEEWGLMLCNDLSIGAAVPRYRFIEIPEMSGALDLTEALTGSVPYDQRTITFTLFAVHDVIAGTRSPATEEHFQTVLARFSGFANGKRLHVYLPDNPDHYFVGRVSVGGKSGYNSGRVKVEVLADPYRLKDGETTLTVDDDDFFKTATPGALVTFDDGGEDLPMKSCVVSLIPEQDLNGYDSPWPGGGGKNKLQVTASTQTINGVTFTVNADGSVNVNGTATANAVLVLNSFTFDGTSVVLNGCPSGGSVSTYKLDAFGSSGLSEDIGNGVTINTSGARNIRIVVFSGTSISNKLFKPMIRLASVTDATFSPYSNICPISGHTGAELIRTGKNLIPTIYDGDVIRNGVTFEVKQDGVHATGTATGVIYYNVVVRNAAASPWIVPGTYTLKETGASQSTVDIRIAEIANQRLLATAKTSATTFTITEKVQYFCFFYIPSGTVFSDTVLTPQFELSSSDTEYEPYDGDTYSVTFPETIYGGSHDFVSGKAVSTYEIFNLKAFNPNRILQYAYNGKNGVAFQYAYTITATRDAGWCNVAPVSTTTAYNADHYMWFGVNSSTVFWIGILDALGMTFDEFKTWIANNDVIITRRLASPIEYDLTPQEVTSLLGKNNVWSNDGDISELIYMFTDEIIINNEGMPAIPTINASEAGPTVTLRGASHVLAAGDNRFSDFILQSGENVMQVEDPAGTLTIKYQEGML